MPLRRKLKTLFLAAVLGLALFPGNTSYSAAKSFDSRWLADLRQEALDNHVNPETVKRLLPDTLQPLETVEAQSNSQPEKKNTLAEYLSKRVTTFRILRGQMLMRKNAEILQKIEGLYSIPPALIMSIWGMETSFGENTGDVDVISALTTLAAQPTKPGEPNKYRAEVIAALHMVDDGYTKIVTHKGSWAGAFGQAQFIPSSFHRLAVDGDDDGRKDIWDNLADVFASAANHLKESGWEYGKHWGREVTLPAGFDLNLLTDKKAERTSKSKTLVQWAALGVRLPGGGALPQQDYQKPVTIVAPNYRPGIDNTVRGPVYVVYDNFWAIVNYNSSYKYSLAVNKLADAIAKREPE